MGDWGPVAEDVNRRLLELDPQRKVAMTRLARCLREKGEAEAAEALYVEILALDPANMIASNFLRGLRLKRERAIADELEAGHARVELVERLAGRHQHGDGDDEAQDLDQLRPPAGHGEHEGGPDGRQYDERRENRKVGIPHLAVLNTTKAKRATVPAATPRA